MAHGLNSILQRDINNSNNINNNQQQNNIFKNMKSIEQQTFSSNNTTTNIMKRELLDCNNKILNNNNSSALIKTSASPTANNTTTMSSSNNTINNCGNTKMGSRRIFTPQFKLQVLKSYRNDSDCKGNQRATARKYGIHRRQIQKWLQCEANLRSSVDNLNNQNHNNNNNNNNVIKHQFHNISHQQSSATVLTHTNNYNNNHNNNKSPPTIVNAAAQLLSLDPARHSVALNSHQLLITPTTSAPSNNNILQATSPSLLQSNQGTTNVANTQTTIVATQPISVRSPTQLNNCTTFTNTIGKTSQHHHNIEQSTSSATTATSSSSALIPGGLHAMPPYQTHTPAITLNTNVSIPIPMIPTPHQHHAAAAAAAAAAYYHQYQLQHHNNIMSSVSSPPHSQHHHHHHHHHHHQNHENNNRIPSSVCLPLPLPILNSQQPAAAITTHNHQQHQHMHNATALATTPMPLLTAGTTIPSLATYHNELRDFKPIILTTGNKTSSTTTDQSLQLYDEEYAINRHHHQHAPQEHNNIYENLFYRNNHSSDTHNNPEQHNEEVTRARILSASPIDLSLGHKKHNDLLIQTGSRSNLDNNKNIISIDHKIKPRMITKIEIEKNHEEHDPDLIVKTEEEKKLNDNFVVDLSCRKRKAMTIDNHQNCTDHVPSSVKLQKFITISSREEDAADADGNSNQNSSHDEKKHEIDVEQVNKPVKLFKPYLLDNNNHKSDDDGELEHPQHSTKSEQKDPIIWSHYPNSNYDSQCSSRGSNFQGSLNEYPFPSGSPIFQQQYNHHHHTTGHINISPSTTTTLNAIQSPVSSSSVIDSCSRSSVVTPASSPKSPSIHTPLNNHGLVGGLNTGFWCPKGSPVSGYDTASTYSDCSSDYYKSPKQQTFLPASTTNLNNNQHLQQLHNNCYNIEMKMQTIDNFYQNEHRNVNHQQHNLTQFDILATTVTSSATSQQHGLQHKHQHVQRWLDQDAITTNSTPTPTTPTDVVRRHGIAVYI